MLGDNLRKLRAAAGLTQVELANKLGVTKQSVSNWENENIQPSVDMIIKISKLLNIKSDVLLGLDERYYIEVTGLSNEKIAHIHQIINDMQQK